jgi:PAS domain-containing protein
VHALTRLNRVRAREPHELEYPLADGRVLAVRYSPIANGGLALTYADVTARKAAEAEVARKEGQLRTALDNMPGALAYTDYNLDVVVFNDRYAEIYQVPPEMVRPGRPYPDLLRWLAEHGHYGEGDVDALVAARVRACAIQPARLPRTAPRTARSTRSIAAARRPAGR